MMHTLDQYETSTPYLLCFPPEAGPSWTWSSEPRGRHRERESVCVCERERYIPRDAPPWEAVMVGWFAQTPNPEPDPLELSSVVQGYLAHKEQPPPSGHHRALGMFLL